MENVEHFSKMGGLVAPGSDAGAWAVDHGMDTEWALLTRAIGDGASDILTRGARHIMEKF